MRREEVDESLKVPLRWKDEVTLSVQCARRFSHVHRFVSARSRFYFISLTFSTICSITTIQNHSYMLSLHSNILFQELHRMLIQNICCIATN